MRGLVSCCNVLVSRVRRVRHAIFAASLATAIGVGNAGRADVGTSPLALTWEAPPGCPTVDEVAGEVERTLAKSGTPAAPFTAAAYVVGGPGQTWEGRLVLNLHGAETERRFAAESCEALASAAALIIAVALDEASDQPLSPVVDVETPARVRPATAAPAAYSLGANAIVDFKTLPTPPGAGLEAVIRGRAMIGPIRPGWMAGVTVLRNLQPAVNNLLGPVAGDFWLFSLSGRGCLGVAVARLEIAPCVGAELDAMHATNSGWAEVSAQTETHYLFSLLGSLALSYEATPSLELMVRADAVLPTSRPTFSLYNNVLPAYVVPGPAFRGALGAAWRFH
ncbi:MAG TPA: hypothetical protein VN962_04260 [Polyangia bacterium]|nr:hypothetical protein [Polyangia bacterium]